MTSAGKPERESGMAAAMREATVSMNGSQRPKVTLSWAQSLDGCIAAHRDSRLRISGEESMRMTHRMRAEHDAILVGIGTVLADDPKLTVRLVEGRSPRPVVADASLRLPPDCSLMRRADCKPWIFTTSLAAPERREVLESLGARIFEADSGVEGQVDLVKVLEILGMEGIRNLMVEGGGRILASFLRLRLADSVTVTIGPLILGGYNPFSAREQAVSGLKFDAGQQVDAGQQGEPGIDTPEVRATVPGLLLKLSGLKTRLYGQDIVLTGIPVR